MVVEILQNTSFACGRRQLPILQGIQLTVMTNANKTAKNSNNDNDCFPAHEELDMPAHKGALCNIPHLMYALKRYHTAIATLQCTEQVQMGFWHVPWLPTYQRPADCWR